MRRHQRIFLVVLATMTTTIIVVFGGEQLAMPVPAAPYAEYPHAIGVEHEYPGTASKVSRRCQSCFLRDATRMTILFLQRGVVGTQRQWTMRICNVCATSLAMDTLALVSRCEQCSRGAVFGVELTSSTSARSRGLAVRCGRHKVEGDTDVKHRRCTRPGCGRQAVRTNGVFLCSFHRSEVKSKPAGGAACGYDGCDRSPIAATGEQAGFCSRHSHLDLLRAKTPKCKGLHCQRTPSYGEKDGQPVYCAAHRLAEHVDLKNRRCLHASPDGTVCQTQATFGNPKEPHLRYCKLHRMPFHIDLRNKRCLHAEGCSKVPSFGNATTGVARYCKQHRRPGHVMVVRKMSCHHPQGCSSQARYGTPESGPKFCRRHCNPMEHISLFSRRNITSSAASPGHHPDCHDAASNVNPDGVENGAFGLLAPSESNELSVLEFGSDEGMGLGLDGEERVRAEIAAQLQHSDFANISSLAWEFLTDGRRSAHVETPATRGDWDDMTEGELEQELEARGVQVKPYKTLLVHCLNLVSRRKSPLRPHNSLT